MVLRKTGLEQTTFLEKHSKRAIRLTRSVPCGHVPATFLAKHLCGGCQLFASFCLSSVPLLFAHLPSSQDPTTILEKKVVNTVHHVFLLSSSPFLLSVLGLELEMNVFSSLQTHSSFFSSLNFPVPFSTLFTPSLSLLTDFFLCQHKCAVITPYTTQIAALLSFFSSATLS